MNATLPTKPRIALVHALAESIGPIHAAFAETWPDAETFDVQDLTLAPALAAVGGITPEIVRRFVSLGREATREGPDRPHVDAVLFTCSAFDAAIAAVRHELEIPVHTPTQRAVELAITLGSSIAVIATYEPSTRVLTDALELEGARRRRGISLRTAVARTALARLQSGDADGHDREIAAIVRDFGDCEVILLAQFSMARARRVVDAAVRDRVLTTPTCAVDGIRAAVIDARRRPEDDFDA